MLKEVIFSLSEPNERLDCGSELFLSVGKTLNKQQQLLQHRKNHRSSNTCKRGTL